MCLYITKKVKDRFMAYIATKVFENMALFRYLRMTLPKQHFIQVN